MSIECKLNLIESVRSSALAHQHIQIVHTNSHEGLLAWTSRLKGQSYDKDSNNRLCHEKEIPDGYEPTVGHSSRAYTVPCMRGGKEVRGGSLL